ncbi:unnamed protein product [Soboliphyme baturini]|uniref:Uncharacterized protein n=1 Tax=Soboliphyme baturini TaxID=241478 RepID=A0A183IKX8_9BILA|nr:unnamed protein product [Soboliphyme baturini]
MACTFASKRIVHERRHQPKERTDSDDMVERKFPGQRKHKLAQRRCRGNRQKAAVRCAVRNAAEDGDDCRPAGAEQGEARRGELNCEPRRPSIASTSRRVWERRWAVGVRGAVFALGYADNGGRRPSPSLTRLAVGRCSALGGGSMEKRRQRTNERTNADMSDSAAALLAG